MRKNFLWLILIIILAGYCINFFIHAYQSITYPYGLDYTEGIVFEFVHRIAAAEAVYLDLKQPPYLVFVYTPLYFLINAIIVKIFGVTFFYGRLLSVLFSVFSAVIAGFISRRVTSSEKIGLLVFALTLSGRFLFRWGNLYRPDTMALFLTLIGSWFFILYKVKKQNIVLAALFFTIAVFTKQNHCFAPFAALLFLIIYERENLLIFIVSLLGFGFAGLGLIEIVTSGHFLQHIIQYNLNSYSFGKGVFMAFVIFAKYGIYFFIIFLFRNDLKNGGRNIKYLLIYLIVSSIGVLSVGKIGSDTNHYLEFSFILIIILGVAIKFLLYNNNSSDKPYYKLARLLPIFIIFEVITLNYANNKVAPAYIPDNASIISYSEVVQWLKIKGGKYIYSEATDLLVIAGKRLIVDPFLICTLIKQHAISKKAGTQEIDTRWFNTVLLKFNPNNTKEYNQWHKERLTPEMLNSLINNYRLVKKFGPFYFADSESNNYWFPEINKNDWIYVYQPMKNHLQIK